MDYKNKYLKYKNKYLNIKKSFLYLGGAEQTQQEELPHCINLLKPFLEKEFGLSNELLYSTTFNIIKETSKTSDCKIFALPQEIHERIQTFMYEFPLVDIRLKYLHDHHPDLYKLITGPTTWENRMKRIIELLKESFLIFKQSVFDSNGKIINQVTLTIHNNPITDADSNILRGLIEKIIYLYNLLIYNIIENNIIGEDFQLDNKLKEIFDLLIKTLVYISISANSTQPLKDNPFYRLPIDDNQFYTLQIDDIITSIPPSLLVIQSEEGDTRSESDIRYEHINIKEKLFMDVINRLFNRYEDFDNYKHIFKNFYNYIQTNAQDLYYKIYPI